MSEAGFTLDVLDLARDLGVWAHHCRDSRRCEGQRGFPDLILAGRGGIIAWELKMPSGVWRPGQRDWLLALRAAGAETGMRQPKDMDQIRTELEALA